jgi:multidrug efflux pump subunit AcrA (membrane-fusion protein)
VEWARFNLEQLLAKWQALASVINISGNPEFYTEDSKKNLETVRNYLDLLAFGVNALMVDSTLSKTTLDAYKSDISTARTNINTAIVNLSSADEKFKTAQSSLTLAENELLLKKAGATPEQIAAQEAQVNQAEAKIQVIQAQIEKSVIASPINGVVIKQDAKVAETIIEGVATYKITMQFAKEDDRVKPGMTANVDIVTAERQATFAIPQRAVIDKNNGKIARVLDGENVKEVSVKTGVRDSEGNIEILEGINEGDKVIVFVKEE